MRDRIGQSAANNPELPGTKGLTNAAPYGKMELMTNEGGGAP